MDVSVIIVSWNTKDILMNCLRSLYDQSNRFDFEVIVVDNASADGSVEMVKNDFHSVVLVENSENKGFATANNQGISIAEGRYILLLNSDTIVLDNAIVKTVYFADDNPKASVIGCRVLNPDRSLQPTCFMFPSILNMILSSTYLYKLFPRSRFFGRERMTWWKRNDVQEVDVVTGCFMLVRRAAIEQVGVMDESFFMYGEETDWCYRFKQAGWLVMFAPAGEIIHLGGQSSQRIRWEMLVRLRLSILQFMKKHCNWLVYRLACFLIIVFFLVRVPVWTCIGLFSPKKRRQSFDRAKAYLVGIGKITIRSSSF